MSLFRFSSLCSAVARYFVSRPAAGRFEHFYNASFLSFAARLALGEAVVLVLPVRYLPRTYTLFCILCQCALPYGRFMARLTKRVVKVIRPERKEARDEGPRLIPLEEKSFDQQGSKLQHYINLADIALKPTNTPK